MSGRKEGDKNIVGMLKFEEIFFGWEKDLKNADNEILFSGDVL